MVSYLRHGDFVKDLSKGKVEGTDENNIVLSNQNNNGDHII